MKNKLTILLVLILVGFGIWWFNSSSFVGEITNFEECVEAGNPVMESYPRQCSVNDQTFVEDIGNELEKRDLIRVDNPRPNETVSSNFTITGEARGSWYFEATFPVEIQDEEGNVIFEHYAEAQDSWMTTEFVPFEAEVNISSSTPDSGNILLRKSNASGLPEHDDFLRIPINFE